MAIAIVQSESKNVSGVNNTTLAFPSNVTAGNWIGVTISAFRSGGATIQTPTDTLGNTYNAMTAQNGSSVNTALRSYYAENTSGGANTVTFDLDGAGTGELAVTIAEFSGVKTSSSLDTSNLATGSGTAVSSGNVTPSVTGSLLYAAAHASGNNTAFTEEATWTRLQQEQPATKMGVTTEWKLGTTSAEDADWTAAPTTPWAAHIAAFEPAPSNITGTGSVTLGADIVTSAGTVAIAGAGQRTLGPDTLAAAGATAIAGAGAPTLDPDTLIATEEPLTFGSAAIEEGPSTLLSGGAVSGSGQAAIQEGATILSAAGQALTVGAAAIAESPTTASGTFFAPMPIQSAIVHASGVNSATLVFPNPLTAGSMIHVAVVTFQSTPGTTITTPTDTLGHTYQPATAQQNNTPNTVHLRTWHVPGCSAGACTMTVDISGAGLGEIAACASEWPGRDLVSPLSGTPSLFGPVTTTAPDTGDMLPSHDDSLLIAVLHAGGVANTMTQEAGWTLLRKYEGDDDTVTLAVVWKTQGAAVLDGASWTVSPNSICLANVAAYRPAGTVGITGVAAIVLGPDVSASGATGVTGSRMMLLGVGR